MAKNPLFGVMFKYKKLQINSVLIKTKKNHSVSLSMNVSKGLQHKFVILEALQFAARSIKDECKPPDF